MDTIPQSGNEPRTDSGGNPPNVPQELPLKSATSYANRPQSPDVLRKVKTDIQSSSIGYTPEIHTPLSAQSIDDTSMKDTISETGSPESQSQSHPLGPILVYIEPFLGNTWFNYGLIISMVILTYFLTKLRLGVVTCLGLGYLIAQLYKLSWKSTYLKEKQNIKDSVNGAELDTDYEKALWVNQFLNRYWYEFENYLTKTIVESVEPIITPYLPAFVPWVKFTTFTVGTKAPIIESIKGFRRIETDLVLMDAEVSFTPYAEENLNEDKTNLKIVITARIQFGSYGLDIPVYVDNVHLHAFARIKLRFMNDFPHIRMVETSLLNTPIYDYSVRLYSERFGYDLTHIPYLQTFIKKQVNAILDPMMFAPNKFILDLEAIMSGGVEANFPIGVLQIYIDSARGLKNTELLGVPDPFVSLNIEGRQEIGRTQVVSNNLNPTWGESFTILVHSLSETLNLKVMNHNLAKESKMGAAQFNLSSLPTNPRQDLVTKVMRNTKTIGEMSFRVNYFPTADPVKNEDGTEQVIESDSAIVRFHLRQVEGMKKGGNIINLTKNQAQLILDLNGKVAHKSPFKNVAGNMVFEDAHEIFIESIKKTNVKVSLRLSDRTIIGHYSSTLSEIMANIADNKEWFKFQAPGYEGNLNVKLDVRLKPVIVDPNAIQGILPPIGFVRVDVIEAKGLKGGELISKPEPYCQVIHSNKLVGKTRWLDNTSTPVWNDVYYIPVHGEGDALSFEVMHFNSVQKDKLLGKASIPIKPLLGPQWGYKEGYQHGEPHNEWYPLNIKEEKERGSVHLNLQYFSLHPHCLKDTKEVEQVLDQAKDNAVTETKTHETQDTTVDSNTLASVNPDELQKVHEEVDSQFKATDYNAGILRIILHEAKGVGNVKSNVHAVVLVNNNERIPVHKTTSKRGSNPIFEDTCQTFIKEVDIDRITVSIRSTKEGGQGKEAELAKWTGPVKEIIENLSEESRIFNFTNNTIGELRLSFNFDACDYTINPSESGRNMGILQVTVVNAENLVAADRSGTSDPYVSFILNGEKAFKTETHKKSINPEFNETFTVAIEDRIKSKFVMEVFDWNQLEKHKSLGSAQLDLSLLDVETPFDVPVELENVKSGVVNLRMFFAPQYVLEDDEKNALPGMILGTGTQFATGLAKGGAKFAARSLTGGASLAVGTGKFAGNAIAGGGKLAIGGAKTVLSAPINVAKGGAGFVGSLLGKKSKKDNTDSDREGQVSESSTHQSSKTSPKINAPLNQHESHTETINSETPTLANIDNQPSHQPAHLPSVFLSSPETGNIIGVPLNQQTSTNSNISDDFNSPGSLKLTIIEAEDLMVADPKHSHSDPYIKLFVNRKNVYKTKVIKKTRNPQWNEVYLISNYLISEPMTIEFQVKSYALLGDRPDLGHYNLNTGDFITATNTSQDFWTQNGLGEGQSGRLHLKLEFIPNGVYLSPTLARNSSSNLSEASVNIHEGDGSKSSKLFGKIKKGFGSIKN